MLAQINPVGPCNEFFRRLSWYQNVSTFSFLFLRMSNKNYCWYFQSLATARWFLQSFQLLTAKRSETIVQHSAGVGWKYLMSLVSVRQGPVCPYSVIKVLHQSFVTALTWLTATIYFHTDLWQGCSWKTRAFGAFFLLWLGHSSFLQRLLISLEQ